jgi:hypothetical protein
LTLNPGLLETRIDLIVLFDVEALVDRAFAQRIRDRAAFVVLDAGDDDLRPGRMEPAGDEFADAARRSGDEGDLSIEFRHGASSRFRRGERLSRRDEPSKAIWGLHRRVSANGKIARASQARHPAIAAVAREHDSCLSITLGSA